MITMIGGEVANFVAYIYAPAVPVTPLGALSIIISAVLAHFMLRERLQKMGILGCISCIVGSVIIVIHAPQEQTPTSVQQVWILAIQPAFMIYVAATVSIVLALTLHFEPLYGQTNIVVYLGICSLMGALTVVSIKAMGIAIKLTLEGINQFTYAQTWFFLSVAVICVITQLNYLNKELELFNSNKERKGRKQAIWEIVKGPRQPDAKQCGYYVMRFMKDIIEGNVICEKHSLFTIFVKTEYSMEEINEVHFEWAECIQDYIDY